MGNWGWGVGGDEEATTENLMYETCTYENEKSGEKLEKREGLCTQRKCAFLLS